MSTRSTLNATVFNNGVFGVAHTGQANPTGASCRLILESEATANWSHLAVGTGGTVEWKAGANSFTTLTLTSTTVASLFDGKLSFDLGSLTTGGTFTVVNTNSGGHHRITAHQRIRLQQLNRRLHFRYRLRLIDPLRVHERRQLELVTGPRRQLSRPATDRIGHPRTIDLRGLAGIAGLGLASLRRLSA